MFSAVSNGTSSNAGGTNDLTDAFNVTCLIYTIHTSN
jgi:hypothetical protein